MEFVIVTTVVTPASPAFQGQQAYDLVDLPTIKAQLQLTDTSKDALLLRWITQASAAAARFCNRVFPVETVQDQIFPPRDYFPAPTVIGGDKPLQLSRWPITASPTVTENGVALVENTDFIRCRPASSPRYQWMAQALAGLAHCRAVFRRLPDHRSRVCRRL
jgi:Phage gp6-like head-tail connector protein